MHLLFFNKNQKVKDETIVNKLSVQLDTTYKYMFVCRQHVSRYQLSPDCQENSHA